MLGAGTPFAFVYPAAAVALVVAAAVVVRSGCRPRVVTSRFRAIVLALLPLAGLAGLAFLIEGSMESWSAIYLRDILGAAAFVGALGPASFHAAMFAGRLVGAGIAARLGSATTILVAGSMIVAGMGVALLVAPPPAVAGMAVAALGASFVVRSSSAWPRCVPGGMPACGVVRADARLRGLPDRSLAGRDPGRGGRSARGAGGRARRRGSDRDRLAHAAVTGEIATER